MDNGIDNQKTRPRIKLATTPAQVSLSLIAAAGTFAGWLLIAAYNRVLPAVVPTHFGVTGTPDAWGSKDSLLALPIICTVMYILITAAIRIPHMYNYPMPITPENAERQYTNAVSLMYWMRAGISVLLLYTEWMIIQIGFHKAAAMSVYALPVILLGVFAPLVHYLLRAYKEK